MANGEQLQQLQNAIATVQTVALGSTNELKQVIGEEALAQLANTSTELSSQLAAVMSQVHLQQETFDEKNIEEAVKTFNVEDVLNQVERPFENVNQISPQAEVIVEDTASKTAVTVELPATFIVKDVIASDNTQIVDQRLTEVLLEEIIEADDGKSFEDQSSKKAVVVEQVLIQTVDAAAVIDA